MIVVDEIRIAVVEPLMIGHVGIGGVDADPLSDDLVQRTACLDEVVVDQAGADLVAGEDPLLEPVVKMRGLVTAGRGNVRVHDRPISPWACACFQACVWISVVLLAGY